MAISTAPPPGTRRGSIITLRATPIASCRLRSTCAAHAELGASDLIVHHTSMNSTLVRMLSAKQLKTSASLMVCSAGM